MTVKCEQVSQAVADLPQGTEFTALKLLQKIDALCGINTTLLQTNLDGCLGGLFETDADRNTVERGLNNRPSPVGCLLVIDEAQKHITEADEIQERAEATVHQALVGAAGLLQQPAGGLWNSPSCSSTTCHLIGGHLLR